MKFQNPSMHCSEVILCIKKHNGCTHAWTDGCMNVPEAICPSNFFEIEGIMRTINIYSKKSEKKKNMLGSLLIFYVYNAGYFDSINFQHARRYHLTSHSSSSTDQIQHFILPCCLYSCAD